MCTWYVVCMVGGMCTWYVWWDECVRGMYGGMYVHVVCMAGGMNVYMVRGMYGGMNVHLVCMVE